MHYGHDVANLTSLSHPGGAVGRRVCLTCDAVLGPVLLAGDACPSCAGVLGIAQEVAS